MISTEPYPQAFLTDGGEMGALMRQKDWSNTPVGNPDTWPQSLRTCVNLLLNSSFPMFVWWGKELTTFYNDAYRVIAGEKHPALLGKSGKEGWIEIWKDLSPLVESVFNGVSTWSEDQLLNIYRHGYIEETYFTFSYSPIIDESGKVGGLFCACIETTEKVLATRKISQNERNLRATILQSPVAMCILKGPTFIVEIANKRMYELWGRGADELLHHPIFEGLPEVRHQGLEELLNNVYATGDRFLANERPIQLPRNSSIETIYVNFTYEPFRDSDGSINGILVVATDVTEQVIARRRVEESEARTRLAASSARLGLYELNIETQAFYHSPRLLDIFGLDPNKKWPYKQFTGSILEEDLPIRSAAYEASKRTGELLFEVRIQRPDNTIRWIRLNGKYISEGGVPHSLVGTVLDITEEKKAAELLEQKIEERTSELKMANDQLMQFTYAASHDLQEPLRKISFFVDRLLSNIGPEVRDANQFLAERILNTTARMRTLIDDLLSYSNTSLGVVAFTDVNLDLLIKEVLEDMEGSLIQKGAIVKVDALPVVNGDVRQLRQLFQNLISNALKYHKKDEVPEVRISSQTLIGKNSDFSLPLEVANHTFYQVRVTDNGIGFDPGEAQRIFQLFQRLHGRSEYEGTGVGLAIAKKVADNHKGYIWANSKPGEGSVFSVLLPADNK